MYKVPVYSLVSSSFLVQPKYSFLTFIIIIIIIIIIISYLKL